MKSKSSLNVKDLGIYIGKQLSAFYPEISESVFVHSDIIERSLERAMYCFSKIKNYVSDDRIVFNHLHGDQYSTFLYFLSNELFERDEELLYIRVSQLNKVLHGIDLFGHVKMPEIFLLVHPLGTVIGRAQLSDFTIIYQGVTVGGKHSKGGSISYPSLDEYTALMSNSSLIGDVRGGRNVVIAANASTLGGVIPSDSILTGQYPKNEIKEMKNPFHDNFFLK